jgi:hypothetical protein
VIAHCRQYYDDPSRSRKNAEHALERGVGRVALAVNQFPGDDRVRLWADAVRVARTRVDLDGFEAIRSELGAQVREALGGTARSCVKRIPSTHAPSSLTRCYVLSPVIFFTNCKRPT